MRLKYLLVIVCLLLFSRAYAANYFNFGKASSNNPMTVMIEEADYYLLSQTGLDSFLPKANQPTSNEVTSLSLMIPKNLLKSGVYKLEAYPYDKNHLEAPECKDSNGLAFKLPSTDRVYFLASDFKLNMMKASTYMGGMVSSKPSSGTINLNVSQAPSGQPSVTGTYQASFTGVIIDTTYPRGRSCEQILASMNYKELARKSFNLKGSIDHGGGAMDINSIMNQVLKNNSIPDLQGLDLEGY